MLREIKIDCMYPEKLPELLDKLDRRAFEAAVGYLSTWAVAGGSYPKATLWVERDGDITASFWKEDGSIGYVLGGIYDDTAKKYSFHS